MFLTLLTALAHAEPAAEPVDEAPAGRTYKYLEREEIVFEGLDVNGEIVKPEVRLSSERPPPRFNPLIRLRTDWNAELKTSIDEIE